MEFGLRRAAATGAWMTPASGYRAHISSHTFRLDRDANLNIIRNWVGQNTEETFYDLADEYGMLVWNDFWESTQNYNIEAEDPALFLANAADTIKHFSQSSFDSVVVRTKRRGSAAYYQQRAGRPGANTRRHALLFA